MAVFVCSSQFLIFSGWSAIQLCTCNSVNFQLGFLKEIQVILSLSLAFSPSYFIYFDSMLFLHPIWQTDKGLKHTKVIQISWSWMTWSRTETLLQPALWEELISLSLLDIRESTPEQLWKPGSTDSVGQITIYIYIYKKKVHRFAFGYLFLCW